MFMFSALMLAISPSVGTPAATAAPTEVAKVERKICRREMASESRLGAKRTCLTATEWKARDNGVKGASDYSR